MRLQKYMALCGVASRRKAEEMITAGRVSVNGQKIKTPGYAINPESDCIRVDEKMIAFQEKVYYLLNKPKGYVTTTKDRHAEHTVFDLVPGDLRLHSVGRLDKETEGVLLLTNDGDLTQRLTHPRKKVPKVYEAYVSGYPSKGDMQTLEKGVLISTDEGEYRTLPADVEELKRFSKGTLLRVTIYEGKKRQVRRMFETIGHPVVGLTRTAFGSLTSSGLQPGEYKVLSDKEVKRLKKDYD